MAERPPIYVSVETTDEAVEEQIAYRGSRDGGNTGGGFYGLDEAVKQVTRRKRIPLDAKALKVQMEGLLGVVDDLFAQAAERPGMKLEELQLSVEIDGEGQDNLVGNRAKLGSSGGIMMKFTAKS